jgi:hypothetical protein
MMSLSITRNRSWNRPLTISMAWGQFTDRTAQALVVLETAAASVIIADNSRLIEHRSETPSWPAQDASIV